MKASLGRLVVAVVVSLFSVPACFSAEIGKYQFHVREDRLWQGKYVFTLNAIEAPSLAEPGASAAGIAKTLARVSEVGADSVCFDLRGISEDGRAFSPGGAKAVAAVLHQTTWRRMGALCRVLGEGAPDDSAYRLAAVRAAASAFKNENRAVYWIDGPGSSELVAEFKMLAPGLVVAADHGGDVDVAAAVPEEQGGRPVLAKGIIPPRELRNTVSFVMPGTDEAYSEFDAAMADPAESEPWTPDNSVLGEEERAAGWIALFDGKTLDGWWVQGQNKEGFRARDGAIEWAGGGGNMLLTRDRYDNFILRLEWKIKPGGNSGIFLRAPRANRASKIGMEFQLRGDHGREPDADCTGAIYDVAAPRADAGKPAGEWNALEIALDGPVFRAVLNGELVQDLNLDDNEELCLRLRRGFIGLQDHGCDVAFRNIRLKKL